MQLRDKIALQKIISRIDLSFEMLEDVSRENFLKSDLLQHAMAMSAINVGELVKILSFDFRKNNPQVNWKAIAGFRDIVAHKYETLNMNEVYNTIKKDFPELKFQLEKILEAENS